MCNTNGEGHETEMNFSSEAYWGMSSPLAEVGITELLCGFLNVKPQGVSHDDIVGGLEAGTFRVLKYLQVRGFVYLRCRRTWRHVYHLIWTDAPGKFKLVSMAVWHKKHMILYLQLLTYCMYRDLPWTRILSNQQYSSQTHDACRHDSYLGQNISIPLGWCAPTSQAW